MPPPSSPSANEAILHRCLRDLAALHALPAMCVGREPAEVLDIVLDALPTVLGARLVSITIPGPPPTARSVLDGSPASDETVAQVRASCSEDAAPPIIVPDIGSLWCMEVDLPLGNGRGRLLVARGEPFESSTDRVLVRSAANLVGSTLATAFVLESAHRKDEFLAMLGHELRNPLAPILAASEMLARHPEVQREREVIGRHATHLARLVDDLLDISRITRGHIELRNESVSLGSALERAAEMVAPLVAQHGHRLRVADASDVTVRGDPVRLTQIFGNLLTNAAKFTPRGGNIDVAVHEEAQRVRVTVRDDGRGIAPEQLRSVFEPFVQTERDPTRGGLGLGLTIVKNLVERHGGTIVAESKGRGLGTSMTVELPTTPPAAHAAKEEMPGRSPAARGAVRVLVVDDNVDLAELLAEALTRSGFETRVAFGSYEAIEICKTFRPDAAVLDVGLPDLDGYELAARLRERFGRGVLLIAATGYGQPSDRARAITAGFDQHLVKPVRVGDLVTTLDERVVGAAPGAGNDPTVLAR